MRLASIPSAADPAVAGEAMPGVRLLGAVQRMMRTGMAMARGVNRIARHRLMGQDLSQLAPPGFNPTLANALILQAVSWTAALRERLRALAVPPSFVPDAPKSERGPRERGGAFSLPAGRPAPTDDDWHDWRELARPWRIGPSGVAVAERAIAGLTNGQVVTRICGNLGRAATELGAEADVARIAALEAAARALCPDADADAHPAGDAPADAAGDALGDVPADVIPPDVAADPGGGADCASGAWAALSPPFAPETGVPRDPRWPPPPD